jgi:hypothetical protein
MDAYQVKLPKIAKDSSSILPSHSVTNPGPEKSEYDVARHEKMKLRPLTQGNSFIMPGFKPEKPRCVGCGKLECWCECEYFFSNVEWTHLDTKLCEP